MRWGELLEALVLLPSVFLPQASVFRLQVSVSVLEDQLVLVELLVVAVLELVLVELLVVPVLVVPVALLVELLVEVPGPVQVQLAAESRLVWRSLPSSLLPPEAAFALALRLWCWFEFQQSELQVLISLLLPLPAQSCFASPILLQFSWLSAPLPPSLQLQSVGCKQFLHPQQALRQPMVRLAAQCQTEVMV